MLKLTKMSIEQFLKIASTDTNESVSKNNPNTTIVSKTYAKSIDGINLKHIRESLVSNGKVVSKRRKFQVNNIGVSKNEFFKHLN